MGTFPERVDDVRTPKFATLASDTVAPVLARRLCTMASSSATRKSDVELTVRMLIADVHPDRLKSSFARAGS
jgi:hypothetical protein